MSVPGTLFNFIPLAAVERPITRVSGAAHSTDVAPASANNATLNALSGRAANFIPLVEFERPSVFLSLAPAVSDSYPRPRKSSTSSASSSSSISSPVKARRSSSMSSSGSAKSGQGLRILKLSPVHYGEHLEDHQEDWHEVAII